MKKYFVAEMNICENHYPDGNGSYISPTPSVYPFVRQMSFCKYNHAKRAAEKLGVFEWVSTPNEDGRISTTVSHPKIFAFDIPDGWKSEDACRWLEKAIDSDEIAEVFHADPV